MHAVVSHGATRTRERLRMRLILAMLASVLGTTVAHADLETLTVGPDLADCQINAPGQQREFRVALPGGADFTVRQLGDYYDNANPGSVSIKDASGNTLDKMNFCQISEDFDCGFGFRTSYSGDYFVAISFPAQADPGNFPADCWVNVDQDCSASAKSQCTLPVGVTRTNKLLNWGWDRDWFSTKLTRGKKYAILLSGGSYENDGQGNMSGVNVRNAQGKVVASCFEENYASSCSVGLRALASGTFFVEVHGEGDFGGRYSINLKTQ